MDVLIARYCRMDGLQELKDLRRRAFSSARSAFVICSFVMGRLGWAIGIVSNTGEHFDSYRSE
jgi:predicted small integral membrane protein